MEEIKTKEKWTLEILGVIPELEVTVLKLPSLRCDESSFNWRSKKVKMISPYGHWLPFEVSSDSLVRHHLDGKNSDVLNTLLNWAAGIFDGKSKYEPPQGILRCSNGDEWKIKNIWPLAISFSDMDFSNSELQEFKFTFSYLNVEIDYKKNRKLSLNWENK